MREKKVNSSHGVSNRKGGGVKSGGEPVGNKKGRKGNRTVSHPSRGGQKTQHMIERTRNAGQSDTQSKNKGVPPEKGGLLSSEDSNPYRWGTNGYVQQD